MSKIIPFPHGGRQRKRSVSGSRGVDPVLIDMLRRSDKEWLDPIYKILGALLDGKKVVGKITVVEK